MRALYFLLILILLATPLYAADQALVLTEIEQIQEKIWYLQRDLAAQKDAQEKQKGQIAVMAAQAKESQAGLATQLEALTQSITSQDTAAGQADAKLQELNEALVELNGKLNEKDNLNLEMTSRIGTVEGTVQSLRAELAAQQTRHENALKELRDQLNDTRSKLEAMQQQNSKGLNDQVGLWGAVAALTIAVLLTLVFALKGRKGKSRYEEREKSSHHEL